jgi:hypothetical protein
MDTWLALLVPWGIATIGGAFAFLRYNKRQSGRINTSEAAQVWEQTQRVQEATERRAVSAEKRAYDCEERERLWLREQRENERRRHGQ